MHVYNPTTNTYFPHTHLGCSSCETIWTAQYFNELLSRDSDSIYHTFVTLKTSTAIKSVRIDEEQCMKPRGYVNVHCVRVRTVARRRALGVSDGWHELEGTV